jgi:hypothetical protein
MINKIFIDLDECMLHTLLRNPKQEHIRFTLEDDENTYYTIIRPCAQRLIDYARELVGKDNVYILTTSTTAYANTINQGAGWGFERDHIIAREEINRHLIPTAYGGRAYIEKEGIAHKDNVLIDNLPYRENMGKVTLIGINEDRYLKVRNYYGVNGKDGDWFEEDVGEFLKEKMV